MKKKTERKGKKKRKTLNSSPLETHKTDHEGESDEIKLKCREKQMTFILCDRIIKTRTIKLEWTHINTYINTYR